MIVVTWIYRSKSTDTSMLASIPGRSQLRKSERGWDRGYLYVCYIAGKSSTLVQFNIIIICCVLYVGADERGQPVSSKGHCEQLRDAHLSRENGTQI